MDAQHPDDVGEQLAERVDVQALEDEAGSGDKLPEIVTTFRIMFDENQQGVQHQLLQIALNDMVNYGTTSMSAVTKEQLAESAELDAEDALETFVTFLADREVSHSELIEAIEAEGTDVFEFKDSIVEAVLEDGQERLAE